MKETRCVKNPNGVSSFNYLRSTWGCQLSKCAYKTGDVVWRCSNTTLNCRPNTNVPLVGACTTNIVGGVVMYYASPSTTPVTTAACPASGILRITPVLYQAPPVPAACTVTGPPLSVFLANTQSGARTAAESLHHGAALWWRAVAREVGVGHSRMTWSGPSTTRGRPMRSRMLLANPPFHCALPCAAVGR